MYCPNCGVEIPENSNFCPNCGEKIGTQNDSSYNQTENNASNNQQENFWYMLTNSSGVFNPTSCCIVFKGDHMLFYHISSKKYKELLKEKYKRDKSEGKGMMQRFLSNFKVLEEYLQVHLREPENTLISENPKNGVVSYSSVKKFVFKRPPSLANNDSQSPGKLVIVTTSDKYRFSHRINDPKKQYKAAFQNIFGKRLKYS